MPKTSPHPLTTSNPTDTELDRQLLVLQRKGYAAAAGITGDDLTALVHALRVSARDLGDIPFLLVVTSRLVPTSTAMSLVEAAGRPGRVGMAGAPPLDRFHPLADISVPARAAYLVVDPDPGVDLRGLPPDDALPVITARGRSPLTIDEGVALLTQHADVLTSRTPYSLLGSRAGDRRVPALWVSNKAPRLGWCWAGAPHSWLGSASCAGRLGG